MEHARLYLLVDWRASRSTLQADLETLGFEVVLLDIPRYDIKNREVRWRKLILWAQYLHLGMTALRRSRKGDVILSHNFVVGAIAGFFNRMMHLRRKILALNMIVLDKGRLNSLLRRAVYNFALNSEDIIVTVNSPELVDRYRTFEGVQVRHFEQLSDRYGRGIPELAFDEGAGYVFTGGEGARDWETLLKAASMCPKVPFKLVARRIGFPVELEVPGNVEVQFDTTEEEFYGLLERSSLVALPLATQAPAGLIVLIRAALSSRPVIVTSTSSTRQYVTDRETGVLIDPGDARSLSQPIAELMQSPEDREKYALALKST